jgi:hypothetical protein
MWYADFLGFRENTTSMSGVRYAYLPHGPAPDYSLFSNRELNILTRVAERLRATAG